MRFPASLSASLAGYVMQNYFRGIKRFPLVLMLEPTHRCNLECAGCDRIRLHQTEHCPDLTLSDCISAVEECGAPVVTVTGGEPLLYNDLKSLLSELLWRRKHVYLCTNGILAQPFINDFVPHSRLTLNFHLDGLEKTHDAIAGKPGAFNAALTSIRCAKRKGFRVSTNTSVYRATELRELERLFEMLAAVPVDGTLISPAFSYERVGNNIFLARHETIRLFRQMDHFFTKFPFMNSPLYLDFLSGRRRMPCTPWGNPTRNPLGWKSPCYLITDSYYRTYTELMQRTRWDIYESGTDPRCRDCMVHSGYEATAMRTALSNPGDLLKLLLWNLKPR